MSLSAGQKLAHYEVIEPLGRGGMGEVYRAKDKKLGRDVAIKILPVEFARDEERLARFKREAKVLASLNHPNIAAIYGLERSDDTHYLVLELVEGETLSERLARGPIPWDEARAIAIKIAEALEAAHERGIVHRDLKPANIKLTPDDNVKVLDFGLAKAFLDDTDSDGAVESSMSPTITRDATRAGVILGTAAYMSPEQAKGKRVDKRADIFAFGAVLYEMLTARKPFPGDDVSEVLAAVIKSEPDWSVLPSEAPRALVERCLRKDPKSRWRDIGDVRVDLVEGVTQRPDAPSSSMWKLVAAILGAVAIAAIALSLGAPRSDVGAAVVRANLELPEGRTLGTGLSSSVALSPDGTRVVFVAMAEDGSSVLMRRQLDAFESEPIPGTEGGEYPFFSPDGEHVGFLVFSGNVASLKKISLSGGVAVSICDECAWMSFGSWGDDGTIVFAEKHGGLSRISNDGGAIETLTEREPGVNFHAWPHVLPGGQEVLFTLRTTARAQLAIYSVESGRVHPLDIGGEASQAHYVTPGTLVYVDGRRLLAVPFDLDGRRTLGPPVAIADALLENLNSGVGVVNFDVSQTGTLVYATGGTNIGGRSLVWVDRDGVETPITTELGDYRWPSLSPDGTRVAYADRVAHARPDIWILDLVRGTRTRFTTTDSADVIPNWSPDGTKLAFSSNRLGTMDLFWKLADRTGDAVPVVADARNYRRSGSWTPDGEAIAFVSGFNVAARISIVGGDGVEEPLLNTGFTEGKPRFSPDGEWLAYLSEASGRRELNVVSYPERDHNIVVSTEGAYHAEWSADGTELYFVTRDAMMVAEARGLPAVGRPQKVFDWHFARDGDDFSFDVSPDGERFVMVHIESTASESKLRLVYNGLEELESTPR